MARGNTSHSYNPGITFLYGKYSVKGTKLILRYLSIGHCVSSICPPCIIYTSVIIALEIEPPIDLQTKFTARSSKTEDQILPCVSTT